MAKQRSKGTLWQWALLLIGFIFLFNLINNQEEEPPQAKKDSAVEVKGASTQTPSVSHDKENQDGTVSEKQWFKVYFTNPTIPFNNVYEGGIENELVKMIDKAQNTIDLAVFELDIDSVADALIRAHQRGVVVRIVYDSEYTKDDPQMTELINAGISAVPDDRSALMHNKFFVFDNSCLWTGSFNITNNAAYRNNENAIYFCSREAAENYTKEFMEMYQGKFGKTSPSDTPYPVFKIEGVVVENYFASEDNVMSEIIDEVDDAQETIHFMAFSFTDDTLGQTLISKTNEGVTVEGVFEKTGANTVYSECNLLLQKGLDVRLDGNPRTFHHKVFIIDGETVILGSFNFSEGADTKNDENVLIVHDPNLAQEYEKQYQLMKNQATIPPNEECAK